jgi:hypothetical protein
MHCYTRRHPVRLVLLILFLAGLVTLLVGCSRSRNSSLSGSERITVSGEQAAAVLSVLQRQVHAVPHRSSLVY